MPKPKYEPIDTQPIYFDPSTIRTLNPPQQLQAERIHPLDYYITTGEAVRKGNQLIKEIEAQRKLILLAESSPVLDAYGAEVLAALAEAREFVAKLVAARGAWLWLQSEIEGTRIMCQCKTSRGVDSPRTRKK